MNEAEAIETLRQKVSGEGYLVVGQVGDATGARQRRTADALMVQCWPSRGLSITGVEYKKSRADWRRELRDPEKAESVARYCHAWLVLAPKDVVPAEELPPAWGLWELHTTAKGVTLFRTKTPPPQDTVTPVDLVFLAAVLRAREKYTPGDAQVRAEIARERAIMEGQFDERVKRRARDATRLQESVDEFEKASGLKIANGWSLDRLGAGVAEYLRNPEQFTERLKNHRENTVRLLKAIDTALGEEGS